MIYFKDILLRNSQISRQENPSLPFLNSFSNHAREITVLCNNFYLGNKKLLRGKISGRKAQESLGTVFFGAVALRRASKKAPKGAQLGTCLMKLRESIIG